MGLGTLLGTQEEFTLWLPIQDNCRTLAKNGGFQYFGIKVRIRFNLILYASRLDLIFFSNKSGMICFLKGMLAA